MHHENVNPDDEALKLKQEGDALFMQRDFVGALAAYERAYALSPNPAILYNRARALQSLARFPEALESLQRFERDADDGLKRKVAGLADLMADIAAKVATVNLRCPTPGGRVLIGGHEIGVTPLAHPVAVNAGKTVIEVLADGYFPYHKEVDLAGGTTTSFDVALAPRATLGYLVVRSHVAGSLVSVDRRTVGLVPAEVALRPGAHPVVVSHEGWADAATQVVLRAGDRRDLLLDPLRTRPLTAKWWFWTVVGVAIAGAAVAVTTYALTTEGPAPTGDFSPGKARF